MPTEPRVVEGWRFEQHGTYRCAVYGRGASEVTASFDSAGNVIDLDFASELHGCSIPLAVIDALRALEQPDGA